MSRFNWLPWIVLLGLCGMHAAKAETLPASGIDARFYSEHIQPLFNARCIACHSCFESPCQLNLQTYAGTSRGAYPLNAYNGARLEAVEPTRLFQDALTTPEWRKRGFFDILVGGDTSLLWRFLKMNDKREVFPAENTRDNLTCVPPGKAMDLLERTKPEYGMPYALPSLKIEEKDLIQKWLRAGAPGNIETLNLEGLTAPESSLVRRWEEYLNHQDLKQRVISRYLFEHLFLASFQLARPEAPILRLMRSKTACGKGITPVATRRPNDDPGVKSWFYCFAVEPVLRVYKKHIPYELSAAKLDWLKQNFSRETWKATSFPSFGEDVSRNPFIAFREMPLAARYRFLLEDARYHIMTFIKGPVCNGSIAVNVIQEQFYVFFMDPAYDVNLTDAEFARQSEKLLMLPGNFDAQPGVGGLITDWATLTDLRNEYRNLKAQAIRKRFPHGLGLEVLWNGEGRNRNASLTVFRHDDAAEVVFGAKGDLPKTVFVLDYSTFERLAYNLVVNFDVFGDVKHQALTRLYMDLIRLESENNYIEFLPQEDRRPLKASWYEGALTRLSLEFLREDQFSPIPAKISFKVTPPNRTEKVHRQLIEKILFERLNPATRGEDPLNWKILPAPNGKLSATEESLRSLTSVKVKDGAVYAKLIPEFSILAVTVQGQIRSLYSLVRHREHLNIAWMFGESLRLDPENDSLSILPGVIGAYPHQIFMVEESKIAEFSADMKKLDYQKAYDQFQVKWGLSRRSPLFWEHFDDIQAVFKKQNIREGGALDLSRYRMELREVSGQGFLSLPGSLKHW